MNLKKTLVAAAVAAVAATPVASFASSTLYGELEMYLQQQGPQWSNGKLGGVNQTYKSQTSFADNGSVLGVKGTNDLGNGLTGFYKLEVLLETFSGNTTGSAATVHYGYMGVKGNFGSISAGRQHGLYYSLVELPTDTPSVLAGPLNPIGALGNLSQLYSDVSAWNKTPSTTTATTVVTDLVNNGPLGGYVSKQNSIDYVSPNLNGFTGGVAYTDIGTNNTNGSGQQGNQKGVFQVGGKYTFGPGYVSAAYMSIPKANTSLNFLKDVWGLAGGYSFGPFGVDAGYQQAKTRNASKSIKSAVIQGSYSMGALYAYAQYSQLKYKEVSNKTADRVTAGVFYNVAKPLQVTFEVSQNNKYANSSLVPGSFITGTSASDLNLTDAPTPKASTSVALGANYFF